jgi:hypothetical protein
VLLAAAAAADMLLLLRRRAAVASCPTAIRHYTRSRSVCHSSCDAVHRALLLLPPLLLPPLLLPLLSSPSFCVSYFKV